MKLLLILTIAAILNSGNILPIHENSGKIHIEGGTGLCYGWVDAGSNMRICYTNKERTMCKYLIYSHGAWHEGEPFKCTEGEENE